MRKEGRIYDLYSFENEQMKNDLDWSLWNPIDGYGLDDDGNYPEVSQHTYKLIVILNSESHLLIQFYGMFI